MVQPEDAVNFDFESAERIARVVTTAERAVTDVTGKKGSLGRHQTETIVAQLGSKIDDPTSDYDGMWEWTEMNRKKDGSFEEIENGRKGDNGADAGFENLAIDLFGLASENAIVILKRCVSKVPGDSDTDPPKWENNWIIIRFPSGTGIYRVLMIVDDSTPFGTLGFEFPRFHSQPL